MGTLERLCDEASVSRRQRLAPIDHIVGIGPAGCSQSFEAPPDRVHIYLHPPKRVPRGNRKREDSKALSFRPIERRHELVVGLALQMRQAARLIPRGTAQI